MWFTPDCHRFVRHALFCSLRDALLTRELIGGALTMLLLQDATARGRDEVTHYPVVAVLGGESLFPGSASSDHVTLSPALQFGSEICFFAMPSAQTNDVESVCRAVCTSLQVCRLPSLRAQVRLAKGRCTPVALLQCLRPLFVRSYLQHRVTCHVIAGQRGKHFVPRNRDGNIALPVRW